MILDSKKIKKTRVLVVEDRENWRQTFCELLDDLGYEAIQAICGDEFKNKAKNSDVIILDISMPMEPNGRECKTTGLDVLLKLQKENCEHIAIQNPIIRSMWEKYEFNGTLYSEVKVEDGFWSSRNISIAYLLELIKKVEKKHTSGCRHETKLRIL